MECENQPIEPWMQEGMTIFKGDKTMASNLKNIIELIEREGHTVMNWKPGSKRIFKVLDKNNNEASLGMYSNELRAWWRGYIRGITTN